jgi:hypothetical protein
MGKAVVEGREPGEGRTVVPVSKAASSTFKTVTVGTRAAVTPGS